MWPTRRPPKLRLRLSRAAGSRSSPRLMRSSGVPYSYGGTTPSGFDCSGFTRWVFSHALGRELPRTAAEQSALGVGVSLDELVPGDLLFWGSGSGVYHVGIYAGDGEYIHASTGGGRVMRATFDYFAPDFAKRVIE